LGNILSRIEIRMELQSAFPASERTPVAIPAICMPTVGAFLARITGIHAEHLITQGFRLIAQELFELRDCPRMELPIEVFPTSFLDTDLSQVLDGEHAKSHPDDGFSETMVHISHKPFLPSSETAEFPFGRTGALRLKLLT
jgi:hypothetical protein